MIETKVFSRENLGKLRPWLSLIYDGQSTDDNLIRKYKGEEMKPGTRPSKADGLSSNSNPQKPCSDFYRSWTWNWMLRSLTAPACRNSEQIRMLTIIQRQIIASEVMIIRCVDSPENPFSPAITHTHTHTHTTKVRPQSLNQSPWHTASRTPPGMRRLSVQSIKILACSLRS